MAGDKVHHFLKDVNQSESFWDTGLSGKQEKGRGYASVNHKGGFPEAGFPFQEYLNIPSHGKKL